MAVRKHDDREVLWLKVQDLSVPTEYQRPINHRRVRRIVSDFDPDSFGVLEVSLREDGKHYIMDGQHRWTAMVDMRWEDQLVPVLVHTGLSLEDEARIFRIRSTAVKLSPLDLFNTELIENRPEATAIQAVVGNLGLTIGNSTKPGTIRAVSAVRFVYGKAGAIVLGRTLRMLRDAWGTDVSSFNAEMIKALSWLLVRYDDTPGFDPKRLQTVLERQTPDRLIRASHDRRSFTSYSASTALVLVMVDQYNHQLRKNTRLPQWIFSPDKQAWSTHTELANSGYGAMV